MKNHSNLPGFISETSLSNLNGQYKDKPLKNTCLNANSVLPQGLIDVVVGKIVGYAFDHLGYAVCWWNCVIDGDGAIKCKRKCTAA